MALRDVKNHLSEVVDRVERQHDRLVITRHGKPAAVVISAEDIASLEEARGRQSAQGEPMAARHGPVGPEPPKVQS